MDIDFAKHPCELVVRSERVEKTDAQRALFHAVCADIAPLWALPPRAVKLRVKADFYGVEVIDRDGVIVGVVPSSEDSDREEYSRLIEHAYQMAAESGHHIPDRRQT